MELHKLLSRQLKRLGLAYNELPQDKKSWQEFLSRINNTYTQEDQDRYLLERSMDISSRELLQVNNTLEHAQHIARLGYWFYDPPKDEISLSKEFKNLFGVDSMFVSYKKFIDMVYEQDRPEFKKLIDDALKDHVEFEKEIRMQAIEEEYSWYYVVGHPEYNQIKNCYCLSGIVMDISKRKYAEEIISLHQKLMLAARRAGMAEIATSVLHNIGNVLNSILVSVSLLRENNRTSYYKKIFKIIGLLKTHANEMEDYLNNDPRGKLIPAYLIAIGEALEKEYNGTLSEIDNINSYIQHIAGIVATQKNISGISGINEKIFVPEILDTAIQMCDLVQKNTINLIKDYQDSPFIVTDKSKLIQILVNLIQNAKDSVLKSPKKNKEIICSIKKKSKNILMLCVTDNGIGIDPQDYARIFSFGFTTKEKGHGFGLHTSALAANEMGGSLRVVSDGIDQGAKFILTLPYK